jgi:hypothetical protein
MQYSFDVQEAVDYGEKEAIIIWNFRFWILKNKANGKNLYEGRTWTYNKVRILDSMVQNKIIIKGNFNQNKHDRTTWYAFYDEEKFLASHLVLSHFSDLKNGDFKNENSILQNQKKEISEMKNDNSNSDIKTNIKTFSFSENQNPEIEKKEKVLKNKFKLNKNSPFEAFIEPIKSHWILNDYKSNVEEFLLYWKTNIHEAFKKLDYTALRWEQKYLKDKDKFNPVVKENFTTESPKSDNKHNEAIERANIIQEYCKKKYLNPFSLSKEEKDKIINNYKKEK